MTLDPDAALVERCQQGEDPAFQELIDRHKERVFAAIGALPPGAPPAADLALDVFLRVQRGLPYFQGRAPLSTWIDRVVADVRGRHGAFDSPPEGGSATPAIPAGFTARTATRLRQDRWRRDQMLDTGFNLALLLIAVAIVGIVLLLLFRTGLSAVVADTFQVYETGFWAVGGRLAEALPLYLEAGALLAGALVLWWWAEE